MIKRITIVDDLHFGQITDLVGSTNLEDFSNYKRGRLCITGVKEEEGFAEVHITAVTGLAVRTPKSWAILESGKLEGEVEIRT